MGRNSSKWGGDLLGTEYDLISIALFAALAIGAFFATLMLSKGEVWAGFADAGIVLIIGARLGFFDPNFVGLITALCWEYIAAKVWGFIR